ncbi:MAG TPA: minor capsid protein [Candidatus Omnitrophota bacterium]|nr:minor capsid protein [Candidatus Omnitrophota bacterium]
MIKSIATYIENNNAEFVIDTNLFAGFRPSNSQDRCVTILESGGGQTDPYLPDKIAKGIQVLSRAISYWDAREDIFKIYDFLKSKAQITLPVVGEEAYIAEFIEAQNPPQSLRQDEAGRWEFSVNFIFRIREP